MTAIAALLWLHAFGFYGEDRGAWQRFSYPSMTDCQSDVRRQVEAAEWRGLHGIRTECRPVEGATT